MKIGSNTSVLGAAGACAQFLLVDSRSTVNLPFFIALVGVGLRVLSESNGTNSLTFVPLFDF